MSQKLFKDNSFSISEREYAAADDIRGMVGLLEARVDELSGKLKEMQDADVCLVCCENQVNCVLLGCGHKVFCYRCAFQFQDCPVCRCKVDRIIRCYDY